VRIPPVLRRRDFALYLVTTVFRLTPSQMTTVAIGWQVYSIHKNPFDLGLVGLAEFVPLPLLALPSGQLADRISRRLVLAISLVISVCVAVGLLLVTLHGANALEPFLVLAVLDGCAQALGSPAQRALVPELVEPEQMSSAFALRSVGLQMATVAGPALGGLIFALSPAAVYGVAVVLYVVAFGCTIALHRAGGWVPSEERPPGLHHLFGGIRFLRQSQIVLGAITLDLFAVLFGGAVALLPVFAQSILHTGPAGLGVLRSAPAVGALLAGLLLTRWHSIPRAGPTLLSVVAIFGLATIVFGLSKSFAVSLVALAVTGFADMISVNIRSTTVAFATPDELRGRVNAVEMVFISASNQLGAFESGAAAALLGAVPAVVVGGIATVALAAVWPRIFPALSRLDRMESLRPALASD
jgi:MFS family permease